MICGTRIVISGFYYIGQSSKWQVGNRIICGAREILLAQSFFKTSKSNIVDLSCLDLSIA